MNEDERVPFERWSRHVLLRDLLDALDEDIRHNHGTLVDRLVDVMRQRSSEGDWQE